MRSEEIRSLRSELLLRVCLQNALLLLSVLLFSGMVVVALVSPHVALSTAVAFAVATLALALVWCHHGVRTMQIKQYLLLQRDDVAPSWERWLPQNRPRRLLGTRWLVSTKGVLLGLQAAAWVLAASVSRDESSLLLAVTLVLLVSTAGFLFTNPKE